MRVAVTGSYGLLGRAIMQVLELHGHEVGRNPMVDYRKMSFENALLERLYLPYLLTLFLSPPILPLQVLGLSQSQSASGSHVHVDFKDAAALRKVCTHARTCAGSL
jgi:hypothetical protein